MSEAAALASEMNETASTATRPRTEKRMREKDAEDTSLLQKMTVWKMRRWAHRL
jgi:hypothetical protein